MKRRKIDYSNLESSPENKIDPLNELLFKSLGFPLPFKTKETNTTLKLQTIQNNEDKIKLCDFFYKEDNVDNENYIQNLNESVIGGVYWIQKKDLGEETQWLDILECKPHKNSLAPCAPKSFSVCYEHPQKPDWIGLPRFLGLSLFGKPQKDIRTFVLEMISNPTLKE